MLLQLLQEIARRSSTLLLISFLWDPPSVWWFCSLSSQDLNTSDSTPGRSAPDLGCILTHIGLLQISKGLRLHVGHYADMLRICMIILKLLHLGQQTVKSCHLILIPVFLSVNMSQKSLIYFQENIWKKPSDITLLVSVRETPTYAVRLFVFLHFMSSVLMVIS